MSALYLRQILKSIEFESMRSKGDVFSSRYVERDISWMYFNQRILLEAAKKNVPLLERLSFLGIYSNNLDEFFRVRVATLSRIIECEDKEVRKERENAEHIFKRINKLNAAYTLQFEETFHGIVKDLEAQGIYLVNERQLTDVQKEYIREFYQNNLNGSTFPYYLSEIKQLGELADSDIYLAIRLTKKNGDRKKKDYALIEMPVNEFGRFVRLPDDRGKICLMFLDDVIRFCLPFIFVGMDYEQYEAYTFKFTKDAEMEIDPEVRSGVMEKVSKGIKSRKRGNPIRLVYDARIPKELLKLIANKLNIDKLDTRVAGGRYHNMKDLMRFPDCGRKDLKFLSQPPLFKPEMSEGSILGLIREKDRYLHFPYHNFSGYLRVLREAAISKDVKCIKTTLYRLAKDSRVVKALICAAKNGKNVTVVIELLARFDEASNINWSKKMQDAGIRVIFGVEGLKIHSKLTYIGSSKGDIACVSTGNFHEGNARAYTDIMMMTANRPIVKEVDSVFSFIEKPYTPRPFRHLLVSPNDMRRKLITMINGEIKRAKAGKEAYMMAKINHITDKPLVKKLYEASAAGVRIDLLVRGNCSLVTGIPGVSDTIRVNGIIDRYLEHSRIIIFGNGGDERYFIGSADWMTRNLDNRIEVMTPVCDPDIQRDLKRIIEFGLKDTAQGHIVDGTGRNLPWTTEDNAPFRSQEALYACYKNEQ